MSLLLKAELFMHAVLFASLLLLGGARLKSDPEMCKRFFGAYAFYQLFVIALIAGGYAWMAFLSVLAAVATYEIVNALKGRPGRQVAMGFLFLGLSLLSYYSFFRISPSGDAAGTVLWICSVIQFSDIAAYVVGKKFGKRKILPAVSPGKTYEGTLGALAASLPFSAFLLFYLNLPSKLFCLWMTVPLVLLGQVGDVTESLFKRMLNRKDLGAIVYGHGGVCDRMDSFLLAMPLWLLISRN